MGIIRLNQLPVATGTTSDDYILIMDDPSGSGITKVVPVSGLSIAGGGGISGNGTNNYVTKWTSTSGVGNSLIYDNGTNIGIGTISPSGKLHIVGTNAIYASGNIKVYDSTVPGYVNGLTQLISIPGGDATTYNLTFVNGILVDYGTSN